MLTITIPLLVYQSQNIDFQNLCFQQVWVDEISLVRPIVWRNTFKSGRKYQFRDNSNHLRTIHEAYNRIPTFSLTHCGSAIDARLHTAVSVGLEYSIISAHKFDDLIVPKC